MTDEAPRIAALLAAVGFLVIAAFQAALALGAPFGPASWGGRHAGILPARLRIASAVAAVVWFLAALIVLGRGGFDAGPIPDGVTRWGTWVLVGLLPVGALMNLASSSRWERFLWGPIALILAALCFVVARSPAS